MASYVSFTALDGLTVQINPEEVFSLTPVPGTLLPTGIAAGTYIADEDGARVAVQGTVLATATALASGATTQPRMVASAAGTILAQNGISGPIQHVANSGVYVIPIAGGLLLDNEPLSVSAVGPVVAQGISIQATWSNPDEVTVTIVDVTAVAAPIDTGFALIITPV